MGDVWVEAIGDHPDCRMAATYDPDADAAQAKAEASGSRAAPTLTALLEDPAIGCVVVATPSFTHPQVVSLAAATGKHILCEKPMALTVAKCRAMIADCERAGVTLVIGQTIRFWGAYYTARQLVADGAIGTPCLAQVHRMGTAGVRQAPKGPDTEAPPTRWRFDTEYSGGDMLEGLLHELDFSRSLLGEVSTAYCVSSGKEVYNGLMSPTVTQATLAFEDGGLATARMGGIVGFPCRGSWVAGTSGTLSWDEWETPVKHHKPGGEVVEVPASTTSAYTRELCDFLAAVDDGVMPENSPRNGLRNVALGLALYRSMELGERISFSGGLPEAGKVPEDYQYRGPSSIR